MPFEYKWEKDGFHSRFWGTVLEEEIDLKNRKFSTNPRCGSSRYQIFDGSGIDKFKLSVDGIAKMATNDIGMGFYLRDFSVVLVGSKPNVVATYRQYIEYCRIGGLRWDFHVCKSLEDARLWLDPQKVSPSECVKAIDEEKGRET